MKAFVFTLAAVLTVSSLFAQRVDEKELQPLSAFKNFPQGAVYQNTSLSPEARARDVLKHLTFEEKLSLTGGYKSFCFPGVARLGLRPAIMADASQGIRLQTIASKANSTSFPPMLALAATWNPALAQAFGKNIGEECKAHGVDFLLGPGINLQRLSVGGRNYEYMGEDPLLTSAIAVNYINGLQSQGVIATAKHFIANDQEFVRHIASSDLDERTLREIYLKPWEAVVKQARVRAIMTGNNAINGIPASMHQPLLNDVMRREFGFTGVTMTDWQNTNYHPDLQYLVARSGQTLLMANNATFTKYIQDFIARYPARKAEVEADLDFMVYPNLYTLFEAGVYDRAPTDKALLNTLPAHKETARQCAEEAICLLKNEANVLPVQRSKKVLLMGENELHSGTGSGFVAGYDHTSFAEGLKKTYGQNFEEAEKPTDAQIKNANVVLFRLNKKAGEGYDVPFEEPQGVNAEIARVAALNPNVVVLISSANGLPMPWLGQVKGVLWTFFLGQERGNALANIISGKVSPSGRLPFTLEKDFQDSPDPDFNFLGGKPYWQGNNNHYKEYWKGNEKNSRKEIAKYVKPHQLVHLPYDEGVFMGYRWFDKQQKEVLFPFGYGLSYTSFTYTKPKISKATLSGQDSVQVQFTLKNTGKQAAAEVVQLYVSDKEASVDRPVRELKDFQKVYLKPGQSQTVSFWVNRQDLSFWDTPTHSWKAEPGAFELSVGNSSRALRFTQVFTLEK
ncbi:beta-glucosidase [Rufibacter ruber]|uniref:beta-glucosidase n=1 Tax=Rufibacter ruber TaxID=1783499 RepID=UPI00082983E8|nr:glycoside hydrolase family 3 N-terminal domain-containing protein [Rufibacter ruber]